MDGMRKDGMMEITHNKINDQIAQMETITAKGQRGAKANKTRKLRAVLRQMRVCQGRQITFREVANYLFAWLTPRF